MVGSGASKIVGIVILVSMFSAANSILLTAPRVYYAMAQDGLFFRSLAHALHPTYGTPAFAIGVAGAWSALLAAMGSFEQLLTFVVFIGWIFYALAAASVFVYRRREPNAERFYRVPGYPLTPLIFIVAAGALVANTIRNAAHSCSDRSRYCHAAGVPAYPFSGAGGREQIERTLWSPRLINSFDASSASLPRDNASLHLLLLARSMARSRALAPDPHREITCMACVNELTSTG